MALLNKHQILAAQDRQVTEVEVPEWGGTVRLQSLDADQLLNYEDMAAKRRAGEKVNPMAILLSDSIVDADGKKIFGNDDMSELGKKDPNVLGRLVKEIFLLNKFEKEESPAGKSVAAPNGGSPSGSP